ncbi:hypothetical protein H4582DRAFT_2057478 [Lactarius indigo]|nr:hypothetical protein H4582DRAFT_2057478 [Lactarius indigo]
MSVNVGRDGAYLSGSASQGASSSSLRQGSAANLNHRSPSVHPNNDQGDGPSAGIRDPPPPLGVKLTCYRLLNVTIGIILVALTAVFAYKNITIAVATVGLFSGLSTIGSAHRNPMGLRLYWVGLYERRPERNWFFQDDLVPPIVRGVTRAPSFLWDVVVLHPFISISLLGACFPLARYLPDWGTAIVSIGLTLPVVVILMGLVVGATSKRK